MQTAGKLVTPEIVYSVLENKLNDPACDNGYILDGFQEILNKQKNMIRFWRNPEEI